MAPLLVHPGIVDEGLAPTLDYLERCVLNKVSNSGVAEPVLHIPAGTYIAILVRIATKVGKQVEYA